MNANAISNVSGIFVPAKKLIPTRGLLNTLSYEARKLPLLDYYGDNRKFATNRVNYSFKAGL